MLHAIQFTHSKSHMYSQKFKNFERVASKTQCVHTTAFSRLHELC